MQTIVRATKDDIPFIAQVIIEGEKGNTDTLGLSTLFGLTQEEVYKYVCQMLEEEIEGCEFSISNFLIAKDDNYPMAALGAWIEGQSEDNMDSYILRSNLIGFVFPKDAQSRMWENAEVIKDLQFKRIKGSLQYEYGFVDPKYRGQGLMTKLDLTHLAITREQSPQTKVAYLQVFSNNPSIIRTHEKAGFTISEERKSTHPRILEFLPGDTKYMMQAEL